MTTWKEKGVVPDSDDEEDSQSEESFGGVHQLHGNEHVDEDALQNLQKHGTQVEVEMGSAIQSKSEQRVFLNPRISSTSPSPSPAVFKVPRMLVDVEESRYEYESSRQIHDGFEDEISTTYVVLSSPLSSLQASPTPPYSMETTRGNARELTRQVEDLLEEPEGNLLAGELGDATVEDMHERSSMGKRSLRQRNPIQLRPYALEGEKYRRTLMARGMKPLKLVQGQEHSRGVVQSRDSPDPDFDSQDDSEILNFGKGLLSSSAPSQQTVQELETYSPRLPEIHDSTQEDEEEEFPDIDELFSGKYNKFVSTGPKRRKTMTYSARARLQLPPTMSLQREQIRGHTFANASIFDAPASPPETSSPGPRQFAATTYRKKGDPKSTQIPSRGTSVEEDASRRGTPLGVLPTPATSAIKDAVDLTKVASDDDDLNSLDTASEEDIPLPKPDQSLQIKRVQKRIRGVLPASWLRLDAHTRQARDFPPVRIHDSRSLSPARQQNQTRKGVALPKIPSRQGDTASTPAPYFTSDDDSDDDSEDDENSILAGRSCDFGLVSAATKDVPLSHFNRDDVVEDDHIDDMLPRHKRQSRLLSTKRPKNRSSSKSIFQDLRDSPKRQPRITEHLASNPSKSSKIHNKLVKPGGRRTIRSKQTKRSSNIHPNLPLGPAPLRLGILDVIDPIVSRGNLPQFIRIATRNARSKKGLGRQSPTHKFIRLETREDTEEVQTVLRSWREGTIIQRIDIQSSTANPRSPLSLVSNNDQNRRYQLLDTTSRSPDDSRTSRVPRKPLILEPRQTRIGWTPEPRSAVNESNFRKKIRPIPHSTTAVIKKPIRSNHVQSHVTRQAQLETSATEYTLRHPSLAFGSTKKALDAVYRKRHRDSSIRGDVQLARFLANDNVIAQASHRNLCNSGHRSTSGAKATISHQPIHRRKRAPKRLDAGAVKYRQPNETLIVEYFQPSQDGQNGEHRTETKLQNLGNYGNTYTYTFDVFPLPSGVFFHESTFIGGGRLSKALAMPGIPKLDVRGREPLQYQFDAKQLVWGVWDEVVSSELGVCVDWIIEQVDILTCSEPVGSVNNISACMGFIIDYIHDHVAFEDDAHRFESASRFTMLFDSVTNRLESWSYQIDNGNSPECRLAIEIATLELVVIFQLLRGFCPDPLDIMFRAQIEDLLKRTASAMVRLLFVVGLECIRQLYDDLQYLDIRRDGIKLDQYAIQAWVVLILIVDAANMPRASFWDLVNDAAKIDIISESNDARAMERLWYTMFSLLPLCEFDQTGVVVSGSRNFKSFENWTLPQKICKRIFELYSSNPRQAPSFNGYCRTLFCRCHHLIQDWGWRKHGSVVGTFFDFFALHKLAHLRNEEVYESPKFLGRLHNEPSLTVEQEDLCFHVFLKIIALSIKQLREAENTKAIRNLIARLLPNHNRQYPKDETIHQRELASLRNHHDLLCTLFFSAPAALRPAVNLIRDLVDPSRCHREAYLIHLRAWACLSRFITSSTPTKDIYLQFAEWESQSFRQLAEQYDSVDADIDEQLRHLPATRKSAISQRQIEEVAHKNQQQVIMLEVAHLEQLHEGLKNCHSPHNFKFYSSDLSNGIQGWHMNLKTVLMQCSKVRNHSHVDLASVALGIIETFLEKLQLFFPLGGSSDNEQDEDSQGYGGGSALEDYLKIEERSTYTVFLDNDLINLCVSIIRAVIQQPASRANTQSIGDLSASERIVSSWASIVYMLSEHDSAYELSNFVPGGKFAVFDLKHDSSLVRGWTLDFYCQYLDLSERSFNNILITGQDPLFGALYLLVLRTTNFTRHNAYYLLPSFLASDPVLSPEFNYHKLVNQSLVDKRHFEDLEWRLSIIRVVFRCMASRINPETDMLDSRECLGRFSTVLYDLLHVLDQESEEHAVHEDYIGFLSEVGILMKCYFPTLRNAVLPIFASPTAFDDTFTIHHLRVYDERAVTPAGRKELGKLCLLILKRSASNSDDTLVFRLFESALMMDHSEDIRLNWYRQRHQFNLEKDLLEEITPAFVYNARSLVGFYGTTKFLGLATWLVQRIANRGDAEHAIKYALPTMHAITNIIYEHIGKHPRLSHPYPVSHIDSDILRLLPVLMEFYTTLYGTLSQLASQQKHSHDSQEVGKHLQIFAQLCSGIEKYYRTDLKGKLWLNDQVLKSSALGGPSLDILIESFTRIHVSNDQTSGPWTPGQYQTAFLNLATLYVDVRNKDELEEFYFGLRMDWGGYIFGDIEVPDHGYEQGSTGGLATHDALIHEDSDNWSLIESQLWVFRPDGDWENSHIVMEINDEDWSSEVLHLAKRILNQKKGMEVKLSENVDDFNLQRQRFVLPFSKKLHDWQIHWAEIVHNLQEHNMKEMMGNGWFIMKSHRDDRGRMLDAKEWTEDFEDDEISAENTYGAYGVSSETADMPMDNA